VSSHNGEAAGAEAADPQEAAPHSPPAGLSGHTEVVPESVVASPFGQQSASSEAEPPALAATFYTNA
jgi:hypothetical protein